MTSAPEYLCLEDRRDLLKTIEGVQMRLSLIAHRLISDPLMPISDEVWVFLDSTELAISKETATWIN